MIPQNLICLYNQLKNAMSLLSKEDREWRRYQRKADREDRRHTRKSEGTRLGQWIRKKKNKY